MPEKWELLVKAQTELEAEIIKGMLEAQEIRVVTSSASVSRALNIPGLSVVQILVPASEQSQARALLDDYYSGELIEEEDDAEPE
jgi:maleate cis-trans isomerase